MYLCSAILYNTSRFMARTQNIVWLLVAVLLFGSCGVKKNAVSVVNEPDTLSLEQRIASGEFAWLDSIQIPLDGGDDRIRGPYRLKEKRDSNDRRMKDTDFGADSVVFLPDGHYKMYKFNILIDYGRYSACKFKQIQICKDNNPMLLSNNYGEYSLLSIYSINEGEMQYVVAVGIGVMALDISFRFKLCGGVYNQKMDLYHTQWVTADTNVMENIRRVQQHIDSLSNTIPIYGDDM